MALLILRLLWRWLHPVPVLPGDLQRWERVAAQVGHALLYVLMFAASLTGWALAGTFRTPMTKDLLGFQFHRSSMIAAYTTYSRNRTHCFLFAWRAYRRARRRRAAASLHQTE